MKKTEYFVFFVLLILPVIFMTAVLIAAFSVSATAKLSSTIELTPDDYRQRLLARGEKLFTQTHIDVINSLSDEDLEFADSIGRIRELMKYLTEHPNAKKIRDEQTAAFEAAQTVSYKREISAEKLEEILKRKSDIKNAMNENNAAYLVLKQVLAEKKEFADGCGFRTKKCRQAEEEMVLRAGEIVENRIIFAINYIDYLAVNLEGSQNLAEEEVAMRIEDVAQKRQILENLKSKTEVAKTNEEIKAVAEEFKAVWSGFRNKLVQYSLRITHAKSGIILERNERLNDKLLCGLQKMRFNNASTLMAEVMLADFKMRVSQASDSYDLAERAFGEYEDPYVAKEYVSNTIKNIKEAHSTIADLLMEISSAGVNISECQTGRISKLDDATRARVEEVLRQRLGESA